MKETPPQTSGFDDVLDNFGDIFSELFAPSPGGRGADLHDEVWIDLVDAAEGAVQKILHPQTRAELDVSIPPGSDSGQVLRLAGQGGAGDPPGHLYITLRVRSDPELEREGPHVICRTVIDPSLAREGGTISVPSLHGPLEIDIPPDSQSGDQLTLRGCGAVKFGCPAAPFPGRPDAPFRAADVSAHRGDQIVELLVRGRLGPIVGLVAIALVLAAVFYMLWP